VRAPARGAEVPAGGGLEEDAGAEPGADGVTEVGAEGRAEGGEDGFVRGADAEAPPPKAGVASVPAVAASGMTGGRSAGFPGASAPSGSAR